MVISSRTPEGSPNHCPVCGPGIKIEPSDPAGDAPCPVCRHLFWFIRDDVGDALVIRPTCDILRSEDLDRLIDRASERPGVRLVLDLGEVRYMSSVILGRLLKLKKVVSGVEGKLKIENLHPDLLEVFRLTRLDQLFDLGR
jgi:anti-anti-sigma factor